MDYGRNCLITVRIYSTDWTEPEEVVEEEDELSDEDDVVEELDSDGGPSLLEAVLVHTRGFLSEEKSDGIGGRDTQNILAFRIIVIACILALNSAGGTGAQYCVRSTGLWTLLVSVSRERVTLASKTSGQTDEEATGHGNSEKGREGEQGSIVAIFGENVQEVYSSFAAEVKMSQMNFFVF